MGGIASCAICVAVLLDSQQNSNRSIALSDQQLWWRISEHQYSEYCRYPGVRAEDRPRFLNSNNLFLEGFALPFLA